MHHMEDMTPGQRFAAYATRNDSSQGKSHAISLRLPGDLFGQLLEIGDAEKSSMSDTIRMVLWRGIRATTTAEKETIASLEGLVSELQNTLNYVKETNDDH